MQMLLPGPLRLQRQQPQRQRLQQLRNALQLQEQLLLLMLTPLVSLPPLLLLRKVHTLLQQTRQQRQRRRHQQQRLRRASMQRLETLPAHGLQQQSKARPQGRMQGTRVQQEQQWMLPPTNRSLLQQSHTQPLPCQQHPRREHPQLLLLLLQHLQVQQPRPAASSPRSCLPSRQQGRALPAASC